MATLKPLGPLLDEDAEFLKSVIKMTDPKIVMEFGHLFGDSARAMLSVMSEDSKLYSYDCDRETSIKDHRFVYHKISQEKFEPVPNVDFVFLDASHDLELNKQTFEKLIGCMSLKGIIAVHDTGTWPTNTYGMDFGKTLPDGRYAHRPSEIMFVNWILETYPEWNQIHFHSDSSLRHGITLLQKKTKLEI